MPTRKRSVSKKPVKSPDKSKADATGLALNGIDKTIELIAGVVASDKFDFVYKSVVAAAEDVDVSIEDDDDDELETSSSSEDPASETEKPARRESKTVFDMDEVADPLIGTPMEVRKELDNLAIRLKRRPKDRAAFMKIVYYMHKYILGLVFRKYSYVRGYDEKDIYQEALIALFKKAIPSFKKGKGMSFLNFAKMCINRHLITILNASRNRRKDMPLNTSISLDQAPLGHTDDGDDASPLSNVIPDTVHGQPPFTDITRSESFDRTLGAINAVLSDFERAVLAEYLKDKSYREASRSVSKINGKKCNERSIDNALLRIRKKALSLKNEMGEDSLPLVFGNIES